MQFFLKGSHTDSVSANLKWLGVGVIRVSSNEVLEEEFGISEVTSVILERLPVASDQGLLEVGAEPDPLLHVLAVEEMLSFLDQLVGTKLNVLVKEVAPKHLLPVLSVEHL